jgi:hypothetical protein
LILRVEPSDASSSDTDLPLPQNSRFLVNSNHVVDPWGRQRLDRSSVLDARASDNQGLKFVDEGTKLLVQLECTCFDRPDLSPDTLRVGGNLGKSERKLLHRRIERLGIASGGDRVYVLSDLI